MPSASAMSSGMSSASASRFERERVMHNMSIRELEDVCDHLLTILILTAKIVQLIGSAKCVQRNQRCKPHYQHTQTGACKRKGQEEP